MAEDGKDGMETDGAAQDRYGEELLSANWNPVISLLARSCGTTLERVNREPADTMSDSDIDGFLTRFYTLGA